MKKLFLFLLILFSCCARFDAQTHRLPAPQSPVTPVEPILMRPFTNDAPLPAVGGLSAQQDESERTYRTAIHLYHCPPTG